MGLVDNLGYGFDAACMGLINGGVALEKQVKWAGRRASLCAYDTYSMKGFESGNKALASLLRASMVFFSCKGLFDNWVKVLKDEQDLFYATKFIDSTCAFIRPVVDADGNPVLDQNGNKAYKFQFYLRKNDEPFDIWNISKTHDYGKVCDFIANPLDTLHFLKRYNVLPFPLATAVATSIGSFKLFNIGEKSVTFNDVPVLNAIVNKPKDFFVFISSSLASWDTFWKLHGQNPENWDLENICKLASSFGRVILIPGGYYMDRYGFAKTLAVVDVVTQNAGFIGFLIKCHRDRASRFAELD